MQEIKTHSVTNGEDGLAGSFGRRTPSILKPASCLGLRAERETALSGTSAVALRQGTSAAMEEDFFLFKALPDVDL